MNIIKVAVHIIQGEWHNPKFYGVKYLSIQQHHHMKIVL